jgi:hypothetical protein
MDKRDMLDISKSAGAVGVLFLIFAPAYVVDKARKRLRALR